MWDALWLDAKIATMAPGRGPYGLLEDGAIGVASGRIAWVGSRGELPSGDPQRLARRVARLDGALVTPGLIDCHTHLVYGGHRADEFEQRLLGASYAEIARRGGGIVSTVRATRAATEEELVRSAAKRLDALQDEGVTTVEIKSGYGLDTETELRMLRAARRLGQEAEVLVTTTFLGAHAVPPELAGDADGYIDLVCREMLPAVAAAGLADAVDAFCEGIAFDLEQVDRVFRAAAGLGLPVKLHAEQLSDLGGAELLARYRGLSADHLEYLSSRGVAALAAAGSTAVLLPGAFYVLRETRKPPVEALRAAGVPIALATDSNPGSSPVTSILLVLNLACTLFGLTAEEALAGVTREAAKALGWGADLGVLEAGRVADFAVWEVDQPAVLAYAIGARPCRLVVRGGRVVRRPGARRGAGVDP